jgi:hypothetical protein
MPTEESSDLIGAAAPSLHRAQVDGHIHCGDWTPRPLGSRGATTGALLSINDVWAAPVDQRAVASGESPIDAKRRAFVTGSAEIRPAPLSGG